MIELCICCDSPHIREIERERRLNIGGRPLIVSDDRVTKCDECGTTFYTAGQHSVATRKVADAKRKRDGLLSSVEIRTLRSSLALSQAVLEAALGVGPKTVVRWENGSAVQSKALDDVLRLIQLDPDNLRFLVRIRDHSQIGKVDKSLSELDAQKRTDLSTVIKSALKPYKNGQSSEIARSVASRLRSEKLKRIEKLSTLQSGPGLRMAKRERR